MYYEKTHGGKGMSYFENMAYETIKDIGKRITAGEISDRGSFKELCDYLEEYDIEMFYKELKGNVLPTEVKVQYEKICEMIDEINQ